MLLQAQGQTQSPAEPSSSWVYRDHGRCLVLEGDGPYNPPVPIGVPPGTSDAKIVLYKAERPAHLSLESYEMRPDVIPQDPQTVGYKLVARKSHGRVVAWEVRIQPEVLVDYYLHAYIDWRDQEGCKLLESVFLVFHLQFSPLAYLPA